MRDQAERLREIISSIKNYKDEENRTGMLTTASSRVIAITSGKGGVEKQTYG